jgi:hypothetical protein
MMALRGRFISRENNRAICFPSSLNQEKIKALIAKRKREVKHKNKRNTEDRNQNIKDGFVLNSRFLPRNNVPFGLSAV